jgi:hypothetical protein
MAAAAKMGGQLAGDCKTVITADFGRQLTIGVILKDDCYGYAGHQPHLIQNEHRRIVLRAVGFNFIPRNG